MSEAEEWYGKAHRTAPNNPTVRTRYADFLSSVGRLEDAAEQYKAAAGLASDDHEIIVKTATALRKAGRTVDSETYYRRAVNLYPRVRTEFYTNTRVITIFLYVMREICGIFVIRYHIHHKRG